MKSIALITAAMLVSVAAPAIAQDYGDPNLQPAPQVYDPAQNGGAAYADPNADPNAQQEYYDDGYDPQAYGQFESALAPYGQWLDTPEYGRVWIPAASSVGSDFEPYASGGHWVTTEAGWTWVSDYDWGWAPFHYGRWVQTSGYGWGWIPGTVWGPAWVSWRSVDGYVGWAPMGPAGVAINYGGGYYNSWRFCSAGELGSPRPAYVPPASVPGMLARATVVTTPRAISVGGVNLRVNAGPSFVPQFAGARASLQTVAPNVLPHASIAPRVGMPIENRPWVQARPGNAYVGQQPAYVGQPNRGYAVQPNVQPRPYVSGPTYVQPAPRVYAPAPTYVAPRAYVAPGPVYRPAPVYAPAPRVYAPAPQVYAPGPRVYAPSGGYRPAFRGGGFRR